MPDRPRAVLITGCSTGIGRATALRLARAGHVVHATARREETLAGLRDAGCRTLALDVTDEDSMRAAVDAVGGTLDVLVNNAGRADREPQLDGGELHLPRRRRLPRDEARGGGDQRRAALRGTSRAPSPGWEATRTNVARAIEKAIGARSAPIRVRVTPSAHVLVGQRRLMTAALWDRFLATRFTRPS